MHAIAIEIHVFLNLYLLYSEKALTEVEDDIAKLEALPEETKRIKKFFEMNEYGLQLIIISQCRTYSNYFCIITLLFIEEKLPK